MKFTQENVALAFLAHRMNLARWRWMTEVSPGERKEQCSAAAKASKAGKTYLARTLGQKLGGEDTGSIVLPGPWRNSPESLFRQTEDGFFIIPEDALLWLPGQLGEAREMGLLNI